MRVLALDYGSARCGCAISDPSGTIVTPIETIDRPASKRGLIRLRELIRAREPALLLIGLPLSLNGTDTAQTRETRDFAERLGHFLRGGEEGMQESLPIELYDERFTTRLAQRSSHSLGAARTSEDSRAAAHLLESWLAARSR